MNQNNPSSHRAPSPIQQIASGLILVLFLVRFFYVTESAEQGDTHWVVALWFVGLLIWLIGAWKSSAPAISFGWLDLSVAFLAGGHILSALVIIATSGEKRSAINLAWEWVGVVVCWFLLRCECRDRVFRRELLIGLVATGTSVAGLGIYQHYVDFPRMAAEYGSLFDRLKDADSIEAANIRQKLARDNIPVEGAGLKLFDQRLRESHEPFGLFGLANTLGGFLAICLILSASMAASNYQIDELARPRAHSKATPEGEEKSSHPNLLPAKPGRGGKSSQDNGLAQLLTPILPWILVIFLLGWCWLLTKSRTAWIGTAAGLAMWLFLTGRLKFTARRLMVFGATLVGLAFIAWGLSRVGGLDRQVITEAPKSLQYRLQYWMATGRMILDHPWLGVGPGQFRHYYLIYKLPEASEAIADPHNLFLDVAANGGMLALVGLLMFCVLLFLMAFPPDNDNDPPIVESNRFARYTVSGLAAIAWCILLLRGYDDRLLVLLPIALVLFWGLRRAIGSVFDGRNFVRFVSLSAAFALLVHLLGSGGIGMPAVSLLLLSLVAIADGGWSQPKTISDPFSIRWIGMLAVCGTIAMIALYVTALQPVYATQVELQKGDLLVQRAGKSKEAAAEYRQAAVADGYFAEPWRKFAELAYQEAEADRFRSNELFQNAVRLMREAGMRDPANYHDDERLGEWWLSRWRVTSDPKDAQEAVLAYERAWLGYRTNATLTAELAFALDAAKETLAASEAADKALKQDELNHQRGHIDRYLSDPIRLHLENLRHVPFNH